LRFKSEANMDDLPDYEFHRTISEEFAPTRAAWRPTALRVIVAALVASAGVAAYLAFAWRPRQAPIQVARSSPKVSTTEPPLSLGGSAERVTLPPLNDSDALVRTLVQALSESPAIMAWLPTNGHIRNFTVVVTNIADGVTPAKHLGVLRPSARFQIVNGAGGSYTDPRSYGRYTAIADAVASVDPVGAARLYATLKPRIEEAHRELGSADVSFDTTLERAIVALLKTPILENPIPLKPKGIGYAYVDERLESLTAAQKQLLRMGPRNVGIINRGLRSIALALGIPASHLPPE
jgi:Protein of unknown function (DUF3014)